MRDLSFVHQFLLDLGLLAAKAGLIVAAGLLDLRKKLHDAAGGFRISVFVSLIDETFFIIDLDYATFGRQRLDHVIVHVADVVAQRTAGRVRRNERRLADFECIVKCLVADVRDVHQHSLASHFAYDFLAVVRKAIVRGLVGGGIGPLIVVEMGKGHVADTEIGKDAHHADVVADHVAALDAHQGGNLALRVRAANIFRGARQHDVVGIFLDVFAHGVDLIECLLNRGRAHNVAVDPDRKEDAIHAAFAHARYVDRAVRIALAQVIILREQALRRVVVRVDDY